MDLQGGKPLPKSGMMNEENKTNLPYHSNKDLADLRKLLVKQSIEGQKLNALLKSRCAKIKEMITIYKIQILDKDNIILKPKNVNQLNYLIHELTETLMQRAEDEISLGMKTRDLEYAQHETKMVQGELEALQRKFHILKQDIKFSKGKIIDMKWTQKDDLRNLVSAKKENQHMEAKIQGLTEGLNCIEEEFQLDEEKKLKNIIFILLRENKLLKKQLHQVGQSGLSP